MNAAATLTVLILDDPRSPFSLPAGISLSAVPDFPMTPQAQPHPHQRTLHRCNRRRRCSKNPLRHALHLWHPPHNKVREVTVFTPSLTLYCLHRARPRRGNTITSHSQKAASYNVAILAAFYAALVSSHDEMQLGQRHPLLFHDLCTKGTRLILGDSQDIPRGIPVLFIFIPREH